eukprot:s4289_g1.t1
MESPKFARPEKSSCPDVESTLEEVSKTASGRVSFSHPDDVRHFHAEDSPKKAPLAIHGLEPSPAADTPEDLDFHFPSYLFFGDGTSNWNQWRRRKRTWTRKLLQNRSRTSRQRLCPRNRNLCFQGSVFLTKHLRHQTLSSGIPIRPDGYCLVKDGLRTQNFCSCKPPKWICNGSSPQKRFEVQPLDAPAEAAEDVQPLKLPDAAVPIKEKQTSLASLAASATAAS